MAYVDSVFLPILSLWMCIGGMTRGEISSFVVTPTHCITNGSSALAYITPIDDTRSQYTPRSHIFPSAPKDLGIDCKMEEQDKCSHLWTTGKWSLQNSLYGKIRQSVTDWRWEDFKVIRTYPPGPQDTTQKYYFITEFDHGEEFQINFSVLTKIDAHFFLCNGSKVAQSTCYWAMLRAWNGKTSALRLCHYGEISDFISIRPMEPCKTNLKEIDHGDAQFLGEDRWSHITLRKSGNKLTLSTNSEDMLTYTHSKKVSFSPSHILLLTRQKALWKLHNYTYIYCEEETSEKLGPDIPIKKGENCISMFIITCATCHVFFKFVADQELIYNRGFSTPDEKWTEIKLLVYSRYNAYVSMYVTTVKEPTGKNPQEIFWAIGDARQCSVSEHRFLNLKRDLSEDTDVFDCELVEEEKMARVTLGKEIQEKDTSCPENTIGTTCIPCSLFGVTTCTKVKYCESEGKADEKCYCSSGYRTRDCELECNVGTYSHGCQKRCESCPGRTCNNINGYCDQKCRNLMWGPKCDIPPKDQFLFPLTMVAIEETTCQVRVPSSYIRGTSVWLQYKELGSTNWVNMKTYINSDDNLDTISNLKPDTEHQIRAHLALYDVYNGDDIEKDTFRTRCRIVEPSEITISSMKNSVTVTFQQNWGTCNVYNYEYGLNGSKEGNITTYPLKIFNLKPCTEYDLYIKHLYSGDIRHKAFTIDSTEPTGVENITYVDRSSTEVLITWNPPSSSDCLVSHYVVKHRRRGALYCSTKYSDEFKVLNVAHPEVLLTDLVPFSMYELKITKVTDTRPTNEISTTFQTLPKDTFEEEERPYITNWQVSSHKVTLKCREVVCNVKRGNIYLKFVLKCQTEWCSRQEPIERTFILSNSEYGIGSLEPYVNYTITMKVSRDTYNFSNPQVLNETVITTLPADPTSVADVLVTSKDEDFISLRWLPPFPPTGDLEMYQIRYGKTSFLSGWSTEDIKPSPCRLWPNYHCATIRNDISEGEYTIQIKARNAGFHDFVSVTPKNVYAKADVYYPDPPTDVWARFLENNTLLTSWRHPNITSGVVKRFLVDMVPNRQKGMTFSFTIPRGEDSYKLIYLSRINDPKIPWCSPYKIQIRTENRKFISSAASSEEYISPPPLPTLPRPTFDVESSNTTLTVKIPALSQEKKKSVNTKVYRNGVYLLVSVSANDYDVSKELERFETSLHNQTIPIATYDSRLVLQTDGANLPLEFQIGDPQRNLTNPPLEPGRRYYVNLFYVNECHGTVRLLRLMEHAITEEANSELGEHTKPEGGNSALYALFLLVLLVPLVAFIYLKRKKESPLATINYLKRHPRDSNSDTMPMTDKPEVGVVRPTVNPRRSFENTGSVLNTTHSKRIKIGDYESYVKEAIKNGELERQHALFPRGQTKPWDYGACKANKSKNRYNNLIAYDHTRVKLRKLAGVEYSDYINANFIDGYKSPRAYIATQGPKASTLDDFWRMIWQHKVENIVMLANLSESGKKKVEKYWPDINEDREFRGVRVQYVSSQVFADYKYRVFNLSNNGEQRKVEQLHFTSWPDHGVPLYSQSLVPFLQRILKIPNSSAHPVVVHCSAGVGRTGTIILSDICLRMAAAEGAIDCLANLEHLRSQRSNMVDNVEQYKLVHLVVLELLFGMQTHITCDDNMEQKVDALIASGGVFKYMRYLEETKWKDKAMDTVWEVEETAPVYPEKNRFQDIVPDPQHRVFLARYPNNDEKSSYINAVRVDGFRSPGRFIVTQQPMPNTLGDFWRLVNERKCSVIISLNDINTNDKTSCTFWPTNGADMKPVDFLTVRHVESKEYESYDVISLHLISLNENEHLSVTVVSLKNWKPGELLPNSTEAFLSFWEEADVISRNSDPVIVTCYDGATASGLYIAMAFVIDKMKLEHVCDVCLAIRNIRHNRSQFVNREEQFEFLYRVSVMFINGFQPYANFG